MKQKDKKIIEQIDIRPSTSVYATYMRINYKPWEALSEFIDNSTQSFFDNRENLYKNCDQKFVKIDIDFQKDLKTDELVLTIRDNAFGMEKEDFKRAVQLDKPNKNRTENSRNEFGMGLKTAATWFGKKWTVISTRYNSTNKYISTINIDHLVETKDISAPMEISSANLNEHYTLIEIRKLNNEISNRNFPKIKKMLIQIYKRDIKNKDVKIYFNGSLLEYKEPEIYTENGKEVKKDILIKVPYVDAIKKELNFLKVSGWVAMAKKGDASNAGLTLLRTGRAIRINYRPEEVFGKPNSFAYQRVFGELEMEGKWPVTQQKNDFAWDNNELEYKFIDELKIQMKEIIRKANNIRFTKDVNIDIRKTMTGLEETLDRSKTFSISSIQIRPSAVTENNNFTQTEIDISNPNCIITSNNSDLIATIDDVTYKFSISSSPVDPFWLRITEDINNNDQFKVTFNIAHPFFETLKAEPKFVEIMSHFSLCYAIAEVKTMRDYSIGGRVEPTAVIQTLNKILTEEANGKLKIEKK